MVRTDVGDVISRDSADMREQSTDVPSAGTIRDNRLDRAAPACNLGEAGNLRAVKRKLETGPGARPDTIETSADVNRVTRAHDGLHRAIGHEGIVGTGVGERARRVTGQ